MRRGLLLILLGMVGHGSGVLADGVRPVTLQLKEKEPDRFLAQWRVPKQLLARAIPSPGLPASCRSVGERSLVERAGAWVLEQAYQCPDGLFGHVVGINFPMLNATVPTLLRVEYLTGEQHARMLEPGENTWRLPESETGGAPLFLRNARQAILAGGEHFAGNPVHLVFLLALLLLGALGTALRLATVFTLGQLVAVVVVAFTAVRLDAGFAEIGVAVAAVLLAREALRPTGDRKNLMALAGAAGLIHGLGIAGLVPAPATHNGSLLFYQALAVLGMDAALLLALMAVALLGFLIPRGLTRAPVPALGAYLVAGVAVALALAAPVPGAGVAASANSAAPSSLQLPGLELPEGSGAQASRRLAQQIPGATLQSFISIEAFEVRHEVLVRLKDVAPRLGLDPASILAVEVQDEIKQRVRDLVTARVALTIDGSAQDAAGRRIDFLGLDARGALPRSSPVPEAVEAAWIGVTAVYVSETTPRQVGVAWETFDIAPAIPATVTDPESSRSEELTAARPVLTWRNELAEDPAPVVRETTVQPRNVWVPLLSLAPLAGLVVLALAGLRGRRRELSLALARVLLAVALLLAPLGGVAWALPFSTGSTPGPARARQILAGVLPNVYRAFQFPTESTVYDRLALSVTGETLTEVYLEHRRAVEMEERGGARTRVEAVEVMDVASVAPLSAGGFIAQATWTVGGTVTHFGHRHFRENRYDASISLVPVDGSWKIQSIQVFDEKRVR